MQNGHPAAASMFIDYLSVEQVYPFDLPKVADVTIERYCTRTGERLSETQPGWTHEGSYSTSIRVRVDGRRLIVQGNPSAVDRLDNLFGYQTVAQCVAVYNRILAQYGLPEFTRCTRLDYLQAPVSRVVKRSLIEGKLGGEGGSIRTVETTHRHTSMGDGMKITRIDLTTNRVTGCGNAHPYIKALSTQRAGYKLGNLYADGCTVDWQSRDQYRKAYDKATAISKFLLPKAKRNFGEGSPEHKYLLDLIEYCRSSGVVRMEQELKGEYLTREGLCWWGLFDEERFKSIHSDFLKIDSRLKVTAMDIQTISDQLIAEGVVKNVKAANTTAQYALAWMCGKVFDLNLRQVKEHRARLRQIGIDIANPCDLTRFSPVKQVNVRDVITVDALVMPDWYRKPVGHLQLVAA